MEKYVELQGVKYYTLLERCAEPSVSKGCVLLIHAVMSNLHMWDSTVAAIHSAGYSTLRVDHIGHNKTPPLAEENAALEMDDICQHMHVIFEGATGQSRSKAVIGCSIGGVLSLRYAMLFPDDVDQVVAICAPGMSTSEATWSMWSERIRQFEEDERLGNDSLCHATVHRWLPGDNDMDKAARAESLKHVKTCSLSGYKTLARAISNYDYAADVKQILSTKCLIIAGGKDKASSAEYLEKTAKQIPDAKFVLMADSGHLPPVHEPEKFNSLVLDFLGDSAH